MNFLNQLAVWLGLSPDKNSAEIQMLESLLDQFRLYNYAEKYTEALQILDQARPIAERLDYQDTQVMIELQRANVYIQQKNWTDAAQVLENLYRTANRSDQVVHLAYILIEQGLLAQSQSDFEKARTLYERALRTAREAKSINAEGRAQGRMADIAMQENNASFAVYLLEEALPKLNQTADTELTSYFMGRLGESLIATGKISEGQQMLGRALRIAERLSQRRYERLWRQALAIQAMANGQYEEARRHFMNILTPRAEPEHILILCRMCKACLRLSEYSAGLDYARQAVELIQEDSPHHAQANIMAHAALGIALRTMNKYAESIPHLEAASKDYLHLNITPADYTYVDVLRNLAAAQAETHDYDTAQATYQQALEHAQQQESRLEIAGTYRDLGILHTRKPDFQEAIKAWTNALEIYQAEYQYDRVARLYCDIANIRKELGQAKRAMKDYEQALMLLSSIEDQETRGIVLSNAATVYVDQGDIETAESFFVEATKIALKLQDRHAEATRRGNYGWFLMSTGRAERALPALTYALRQSENLGLILQAAVQTDNIGLCYDALDQPQTALEHHEEALKKLGDMQAPRWHAMIKANIAHSLITLNQPDAAKPHLQAALQTGRDLQDTEVIVRALNGLSRIPPASEERLNEAVQLAEQFGARHLLADTLILRSDYFAHNNQQDKALADWEQAKKLLALLHITDYTPDWVKTTQNLS